MSIPVGRFLVDILSIPLLLDATSSGSGAAGTFFVLVALAVTVFYIATMWVVFAKAGKPGWAAIIPIYSSIVFFQVSGHSGWWFLLSLIPVVNIVILIIATIDLARAFGHGVGFGLGLLFLSFIFYPILAFSNNRYVGTRERVAVTF